jgi:predicted nucleotidyltransferase/predicted RNA binding protein YcfA (HicA-like mRNA interferase family)
MRIDPVDEIAGVGIVAVRDFLRATLDSGFTGEYLAERLELSEDHADRLLKELRDRGLVAQHQRGSHTFWETTQDGTTLALASAAKPVRRATAERHLAALLDRVRQINADPDLLYWVTRVVLFGSLLDPDRTAVNDVDVAIEVTPRLAGEEQFEAMLAYAEAAEAAGRNFSNYSEYLGWAELDIFHRLKEGSRVISLHRADDAILADAPQQVVYEFEPPLADES